MKIGEFAARSGVTAHTLRYYEKIGLLPRAFRDQSGQRDYAPETLVWLDFLRRLKATGMPIRDMLRYAALRRQGPDTGPDRKALLEAHRDKVRIALAELQDNLAVLESKITTYGATQGDPS